MTVPPSHSNNSPPTNIVSFYEQLEAHLYEFANVIATYNNRLVELGIDEESAFALVYNWHIMYWSYHLSRGDSPVPVTQEELGDEMDGTA